METRRFPAIVHSPTVVQPPKFQLQLGFRLVDAGLNCGLRLGLAPGLTFCVNSAKFGLRFGDPAGFYCSLDVLALASHCASNSLHRAFAAWLIAASIS